MYQSSIDVERALLVGLFSGPANTDDDYQRYIDSILDADRQNLVKPRGTAILVVERGNPIPNAQWRKRIADATADLGGKETLFVLCADDPIMSGVATAINWIRPAKYQLKVVSSIPAMLELLRKRGPAIAERVDEMVRVLQAGA